MSLFLLGGLGLAQARDAGGHRAAIYARYSSRYQHSIEDQVRSCREWAEEQGLDVSEDHIFTDAGITGRTHNRPGLKAMMRALERDEVDVVLCFATNRLYRKVYPALQFVEEEIVDKRKRCVFVMQRIDTNDGRFWRQLLQFAALIDEWQSQMNVDFVRSAHEGLLLNRSVHGTRTFGFTGEPIEGSKTRRGNPRRKWVIEPTEASWVKAIFSWFVEDRLSIAAIARRLNDRKAPLPPKARTGCWTPTAVRTALENPRYRGDWSYGRTESVWQNKAGYARQFPRETPLHEHHLEDLRLVEDTTFYAAQRRLAAYKGRGGRPKGGVPQDAPPDPLHGLLWCPTHDRPLIALNERHMACPACRREPEPPLYSQVNRRTALRAITGSIARAIRDDPDLARRIVASCQRHAEAAQAADPSELDALRRRREQLTDQIQFILSAPGESEADRAENRDQLAHLRSERQEIDARIKELEDRSRSSVPAPTEAEVQALLDRLHAILEHAADNGDSEERAALGRIVHTVTGGRISVHQCGERRPKRGWLQGHFTPRLLQLVHTELGHNEPLRVDTPQDEMRVDLREPSPVEEIAEEAKALLDQTEPVLEIKEIAAELSARKGRKISRNLVTRALRHWYESRGLTVPDFRARRGRMSSPGIDRSLYDDPVVVEKVMTGFRESHMYHEIAESLGITRDLVTKIVRQWHRARGLTVPDGRTRRKGLTKKTRDLS